MNYKKLKERWANKALQVKKFEIKERVLITDGPWGGQEGTVVREGKAFHSWIIALDNPRMNIPFFENEIAKIKKDV